MGWGLVQIQRKGLTAAEESVEAIKAAAEGHLAGIDILDAVKRLGDRDVFKQVLLEDIAFAHH